MARQLLLLATLCAVVMGSLAATGYPGDLGITLSDLQWTYNWAPCNDTAKVFGLTVTQCQQCMVAAAGTSYTMLDKSYACHSQCASRDFFTGVTELGTTLATTTQIATGAQNCASCVTSPNVHNAWGCTFCMQSTKSLPLRRECFDCVQAANATLNNNNTYLYACSMCTVIADPIAKAQCRSCIASGSATKDYGKCVADAQKLEKVRSGVAVPEGIEAQCYVAPTASMSNTTCAACMNATMTNHINGTFAYGCSAYCQKAATPALATACSTCLADAETHDPWGCDNCLKSGNATQCYTCIKEDWYKGNISNYAWACGACANIADEAMRTACFFCIKNQARPVGPETESNICSCIDLTANVGVQFGGAGVLAAMTNLTAVERSCFINHTIATPNGGSVSVPLAWNATNCLTCMKSSGTKKQYACQQYCQDPALIHDGLHGVQGDDCAACVINTNVTDPYSCQYCMIKSYNNDTVIRQACFAAAKKDSGAYANYGWAAGECASIADPAARSLCFSCIDPDTKVKLDDGSASGSNIPINPCQCVDAAKSWPYRVNSSYTALGCHLAAGPKFVGASTATLEIDYVKDVTIEKCALAVKAAGFKLFGLFSNNACIAFVSATVADVAALAPGTCPSPCAGNTAQQCGDADVNLFEAHFFHLI